jgi:hypothetical protein
VKFRCARDAIKAERACLHPATSHSKVNGEKNDGEESEESTFERRSPSVGGCRDTQCGFWEVKVEAQVGSGSSQLWPSSSRVETQVARMASYLFRLKHAAAN